MSFSVLIFLLALLAVIVGLLTVVGLCARNEERRARGARVAACLSDIARHCEVARRMYFSCDGQFTADADRDIGNIAIFNPHVHEQLFKSLVQQLDAVVWEERDKDLRNAAINIRSTCPMVIVMPYRPVSPEAAIAYLERTAAWAQAHRDRWEHLHTDKQALQQWRNAGINQE